MNRRDFLKRTFILSAGGILIPRIADALTAGVKAVVSTTYVAAGGADYVVTDGYVYVASPTYAYNLEIGINNSAGTLIGTSNSVEVPGTLPGWAHVTFTSGPTLTAAATYYLTESSDGFISLGCTGNNWDTSVTSRGTWPAVPSSINPATDTGFRDGEFGIYVTNKSGVRLIGNSTTGSFTSSCDNQAAAEDSRYYTAGYTCVTQ